MINLMSMLKIQNVFVKLNIVIIIWVILFCAISNCFKPVFEAKINKLNIKEKFILFM